MGKQATSGPPAFVNDHDALGSPEKIDQVRDACRRLADKRRQIETYESSAKDLRVEARDLSERELPDLFDAAGIDKIGIPDIGMDAVCKPYYSAKIPPESEAEAFDWLEKNGHGDIVKVTVTLTFGKADMKKAIKVADDLRKKGLEPNVSRGVHYSTLQAFVKEQIEKQDATLPLDLFGAHIGRVVQLKERKDK